MNGLISLAEQIIIDRLISNNTPFTHKGKAAMFLFLLAAFMLFMGFGFLIYGAYLWMNTALSPQGAAGLTGLLVLVIALLCILTAVVLLRYKRRRMNEIKAEISETVRAAMELMDEELAGPIREHPKTAMLVATMAGFMAGERII